MTYHVSMSRAALFTPGAVLILGVDAATAYGKAMGSTLSRRPWVAQMLVEELLRELPHGNAHRALGRLFSGGYGVSESSVEAVFVDLAQCGWLNVEGVGAESRWRLNESRTSQVSQLWQSLNDNEARAVRTAAQRTIAISVAWSKKRRVTVESKASTSTSVTP